MNNFVPCNEISVFDAVRHGNWDVLAKGMTENAKQSLETYKLTTLGWRSGYREKLRRAEILLLPEYPMVGVCRMQHKDGSDKLLAALKNDTYLKRMDSSNLVMHLIRTDPAGFIWALNEGWGSYFGLLKSRQMHMQWVDINATLKTVEARNTVDNWIRLWSKCNPQLLSELSTPTFAECQILLVEQLYYGSKELNILLKDESFQHFYQMLESLGQLDSKVSRPEKAALFRSHFTNAPIAQLVLPDDVTVDF